MHSPNETFVTSLRALNSENAAAAALFNEYANRKRNKRTTKTDWVISFFAGNVRRSDVIAMFRALEALDCGTYVEGRRGNPSRFQWRKSSLAVCQLATGETETAEPTALSDVGEDDLETDIETDVHRLKLRPDFVVELELPVDFTPHEAERIGKFCLSLPRE